MDCVFCKIVNKEIPSEALYEDARVVVIKDIKPSAPVHYLVIPKEHIESVAHLKVEHREILADVVYAAKQAAGKLGLGGYKLIFNVGRDGGQIIDHLHLHLLGGWNP
ncbi:MAG: histidine triad nucleotide-binding protein [bacterium]|nr:histidine triad nucleotide-binding protein [bacterium]